MDETNKIKYALFLDDWNYNKDNKLLLRNSAQRVAPMEFQAHMKGHIFCPECTVPLYRSPEESDYATNGRVAFYAHSKKFPSDCSLRVKQAQGKLYENEEEAKKAIEDQELLVIQSFLKERPITPDINGPLEYRKEPNEDRAGELTLAAIGRHTGEEFKLPSRVMTVRGLCRNFDKNLYKHLLLPGQQSAQTLQDCLTNVASVEEPTDVPGLYYGRITRSINMGRTPRNIRMTFLSYTKDSQYKDFCIKATDEASKEHGIDDDSTGRIMIAYGKITVSGQGLCIEKLGWGEFSVLPQKYEHLIDEI